MNSWSFWVGLRHPISNDRCTQKYDQPQPGHGDRALLTRLGRRTVYRITQGRLGLRARSSLLALLLVVVSLSLCGCSTSTRASQKSAPVDAGQPVAAAGAGPLGTAGGGSLPADTDSRGTKCV